jgi:hypothetical protein
METFIAPLRDKINYQLENTSQLQEIAAFGAEKARKSARETMKMVREAIGFKTN